jgi:hypothetical protein
MLITEGGGRYVDAGFIGLPPQKPGGTRLHLPAVMAALAGVPHQRQ